MKKSLITTLAALVALGACRQIGPDEPGIPEEGGLLTLTAESSPVTRTSIDDALQLLWSAGDFISVLGSLTVPADAPDGTVAAAGFGLVSGGGTAQGTFSGKSVRIPEGGLGYAVYPHRTPVYGDVPAQETVLKSEGIVRYVPRHQTYVENNIPGNTLVMAGSFNPSDGKIVFHPMCSVLEVKLYGDALISQIAVTAKDKDGGDVGQLSGTPFLIVFDQNGTPSLTAEGSPGGHADVVLKCPNVRIGEDAAHATSFYLVVCGAAAFHHLDVTLTDFEGRTVVKSTKPASDGTIRLTSGTVFSLPAFSPSFYDENVKAVPEVGGTMEVNIRYSANYSVEIERRAQSWISYLGTRAPADGKLQFQLSPNEMDDIRTGEVYIRDNTGEMEPLTLTFRQASKVRRLLLEFYDALDGPHWVNQGGWATDAALTQWQGVSFSSRAGVTGLKLRGVGLKGRIPDCVGEFTSMTVFELVNEEGVVGELPASFSNLVKLKTLYLIGTSMTSLPDIFSQMSQLNEVRIDSNFEMTGPLPESLGSQEDMYALDLPINHFTGNVPASWVKHYQHLSLSGNYLSGSIPSSFLEGGDIAPKLIGTGLLNQYGSGFDISGIEIPGYWPDGEIQDIMTGESFRFADVVARNKYTVELTWAPWCPFSKSLMPQILDYYKKYHKDGLEIISTVMWNEDGSIWQDRAGQIDEINQKGYGQWINYFFYPHENDIRVHYSATPHAFVYDNKGNTLFGPSGYNDPMRQRYNKATSVDLIPFLETLFGPADEVDDYASTDYSKDGEVITLQTASVGKGINIVFLGDAYTDRDMATGGLYETVMRLAMEQFFNIEPYRTFRDRFNVYAVKVVSKNGWIGDAYETALSSVFGSGAEVYCNDDKCYEYALKVPGITDRNNLLVNVLVNTKRHAGLAVMTVSTQSSVTHTSSYGNDPFSFGPTLRHEAGGHGFAFLDDEYIVQQGAVTQGYIDDRTDKYVKYGWFANVDFTDDPANVKWSAFLSDERYKDEVGTYEGSYYGVGAWRPSQNSMMRENMEYFNAPSRWAIYQRIMKLSGEECSFAKFLEYDAVNRGKAQDAPAVRPARALSAEWEPGAPPVIVP